MPKNVEIIVYYDSNYPSMWVEKECSKKIADYLSNTGFRVKNAEELRNIMVESIEKETAYEKLIVFSQDIIPDTIAENFDSNTTIRQFLDLGGNILWMGDIPGYYLGHKNNVREDFAQTGAPVYMLGVNPHFVIPEKTVTITKEGKELGLKHSWTGIRPIVLEESKGYGKIDNYNANLKPLAVSKVLFEIPYATSQKDEVVKFNETKMQLKAGVPIPHTPILLGGEFTREKRELEKRNLTFANAWFKNYNVNYQNCGFYRIWDYILKNLNDKMLNELCTIIKLIERRLEIR